MRKRRIVARKAVHRKRVTHRQSLPAIRLSRIIVISTLAVLFFATVIFPNKRSITRSVAGISIVRPLFAQSLITWQPIYGASEYNLYYKQDSEPDFTNAVRNISADHTYYTVSYLRKGVSYQYRISALDSTGREFWWLDVLLMSNIVPM